jgi:enoyl-CoA hydratase/carnithine racemase
MRLPEVLHRVVPDSGGTARLFQMAGHGLAADLALTGRVMDAEEALRHGVVSRVVADEKLDETVLEIAHRIASLPAFTVKMFRRSLGRMASPAVQHSISEEALTQSMIFGSYDYKEMKAARAEQREPKYRGR